MIPVQVLPASKNKPENQWRQELATAISDINELLKKLQLDQHPAIKEKYSKTSNHFALRVPNSFINRMQPGDLNDPLLRQVLPQPEEQQTAASFSADPVGDLSAQRVPGLLHKYHGRVLIVATGACAIHCRYCFRREYPYSASSAKKSYWAQIRNYIDADPSIREVIISGGDPLTLDDTQLAALIDVVTEPAHIKRLRIHSRLPIVLPSRITDNLLNTLIRPKLQTIMVIHCNHPNEIDQDVKLAIKKLTMAQISCFNQAVLLNTINDSIETLIALSEDLFAIGVHPYYLHLLDRVTGSAHFEVSTTRALRLMSKLRAQLPGYLVPSLVRDSAETPYKVPYL